MIVQELRELLHSHRSWVGGLLSASARSLAGQHQSDHQSRFLSRLVGALMKCCDPEVCCSLFHANYYLCVCCIADKADKRHGVIQLDLISFNLVGSVTGASLQLAIFGMRTSCGYSSR